MAYGEVAEQDGWTGWLVLEEFQDGGFVVSAARGSDLDEVVCDEVGQGGAISADFGFEELLFQGTEMFGDLGGRREDPVPLSGERIKPLLNGSMETLK